MNAKTILLALIKIDPETFIKMEDKGEEKKTLANLSQWRADPISVGYEAKKARESLQKIINT